MSQKSFLHSVTILAGGAALSQGLTVLATPLLSRIYSPEDFGAFGVYLSILSVLLVVCSFRYELAIPLPEEEDAASNLLGLSLGILVAMSCLSCLGVWAWGDDITKRANVPGLLPYLWILPLGLFAAGSYQIFNYWAVRNRAYSPLSKTRLFQSISQIVVQVVLGMKMAGPMGLLSGDVIGRVASGGALGRWLGIMKLLRHLSLKSVCSCASEYSRFPRLLTWAALLNALALQAPFILFPSLFDPIVAGSFFFANRILVLPASLINRAVSQVFFGSVARLSSDPESLKNLCHKLVTILLAIYFPIFGGFALVGRDVFQLIFGTEWGEAGYYAQIMSPMILVWSVASPLSSLLIVGNRLKESLFFAAAELLVKMGAIFLGAWMGDIYISIVSLAVLTLFLCLISIWRFLRVAGVSFVHITIEMFRISAVNIPLLALLKIASSIGGPIISVIGLVVIVALGLFFSIPQTIKQCCETS